MKLRKMSSVLLAAVMILSMVLTGCGTKKETSNAGTNNAGTNNAGTSSPEAGKDTGSSEQTKAADKIIIFQSKVEIGDQLEECAKAYTDETGVEVEVWGTTGDDYLQQLKVKLANNQGPTIFSLAPGSESEDLKAYLADLSDLSFVGDIADNMANEIDGKVVGIPYTMEGFGVVYNKSLIDASKITDYNSFAKMLKDQKAAGINGFSLSQESYFLIGHILNTPFALQADPEGYIKKLTAGEVKMQDTPEFVEFGKFMEAIRENTGNPLEVNYDTETGDFATGKTASIHQGNWCYGMFKDYDVKFDMGIMPLPIGGNDKIAVSVPSCWYINSQVSAGEIQAGKDFLNWLYTSDTGKKYLMEKFGFIPVLKSMTSAQLDPLSQAVADYAAEGKTISWPMSKWPAGIVDVYLVPVAQAFFTTDMTGTELLEKLTDAFVKAGQQ
ncbi:sugar ABC transporter substrate-binding protein [Anaerocolumna xylanovorans]|uniref:Raffinose/stachyose/melibiose transport system substrate-binding protein n=1 Tax=Anaerocolumna xylanovorans DSM 12503 TaxID=1121345 RepID=A0A1M7Y9M0_9FIRM|nr:ABC transporter substrate-binding protein [Anaerocolumna xylanovorans]SHO49317.1 raffinose/stachyose/melibiose transport system substrate-binding protein [Anaerocolumna xylanovorans DSM 12503]